MRGELLAGAARVSGTEADHAAAEAQLREAAALLAGSTRRLEQAKALAGLGELLFWVQQWHDELDPTFGLNAAEFARTDYDQRRAQVGASEDDLLSWRPPAATRGRKAKS